MARMGGWLMVLVIFSHTIMIVWRISSSRVREMRLSELAPRPPNSRAKSKSLFSFSPFRSSFLLSRYGSLIDLCLLTYTTTPPHPVTRLVEHASLLRSSLSLASIKPPLQRATPPLFTCLQPHH